jgi:hypothetical protein
VFARKGRFEEVDVNTEYTPTINTLGNIVTGNIKNAVKEPWSALKGSATPLGCKLPTSSHKNLQSLDQVKTSELELHEAAVVEGFEEFGEFDVLREGLETIEHIDAEMAVLKCTFEGCTSGEG